jgi:hypothetical protein
LVENQTKLNLAGLWILAMLLLPVILLWPIYSNDLDYPFYLNNFLFIVTPLIFFRYIFFIKFTFIESTLVPKLLFIPLAMVLIIYSYKGFNEFINFYNDNGIFYSLEKFDLRKQDFLSKYINRQYIFFAILTMIASIIMPFRMLISVWRVYNKGTE